MVRFKGDGFYETFFPHSFGYKFIPYSFCHVYTSLSEFHSRPSFFASNSNESFLNISFLRFNLSFFTLFLAHLIVENKES